MGAEAIRGYLRELRVVQRVTQREMARVTGLSLRGYVAWERGLTGELKAGALLRAAVALGAPLDDLAALAISIGIDEEEGCRRARELVW